MTKVIAIDPGNTMSAIAIIDAGDRVPLDFDKIENPLLVDRIRLALQLGDITDQDLVAIEQIGHYGTGMPAGTTVFDTCRFIGRLEQIFTDHKINYHLVKRPTVKAHLCGTAKAKDGNVIQALVDRFTPGQPNHGKGTTKEPGWFHGFAADVWQAYALAVYVSDGGLRRAA